MDDKIEVVEEEELDNEEVLDSMGEELFTLNEQIAVITKVLAGIHGRVMNIVRVLAHLGVGGKIKAVRQVEEKPQKKPIGFGAVPSKKKKN